MKKLLTVLVTLLMLVTLAACGSKETATTTPDAGTETTETTTFDVNAVKVDSLKADTKNYVYADNRDLEHMDYVTTSYASDHQFNVCFVDGLVEVDNKGNYVGSLAESWSNNEDSTVWTFNLRKGAQWVTSEGEVYAEVTAEDFVTGLRHAAEFESATSTSAYPVVGYKDYQTNGDYSDEAWAKVGIKAVDDYTVEYTLTTSVPYFNTVVEYTIFYPVNKTFLESKGAGCKLGAPDATACEFGNPTPDGILYNGEFILQTNDLKSKISMTKNANYWDAANIFVDTVTMIYDDGSDPYSVIRGFEQNSLSQAGLTTTWGDEVFEAMMNKYNGYVNPSLSNYYAFGVIWNYNRLTIENTNYATDATLAANTKDAIRNANFRLAVKYAFDVPAYLATGAPKAIADATIRNLNGVPNLVFTSDGKSYGELVEAAYAELTGVEMDLDDGQWPWLNKETAMKYIEAAKADGIQFPVHLDMLVDESSVARTKRAQSMKQSIEENTDGNIIIELVMRPNDICQNIAYYAEDYTEMDYDISTYSGWGPDYVDPKTFTEIYSPVDGYYMHTCGLTDLGTMNSEDFGVDDDIKAQVGFAEYEELYRIADAITDDLDARYAAFAKADALLLANGLYIPTSMNTRSARVSHIVPFTAPYSSGVCQYKFKGMKLQEGVVTTEQYEAARAEAGL